jgi:hypothetical protein
VTLAEGSAVFDTRHVGTEKAVSGTGFTLGGADAPEYTLSTSTIATVAAITIRVLTVTDAVAQNKVYDGNNVAQITGATLHGVVGTEDVVLANAMIGRFAQVNVGTNIAVATVPMTIAGSDIANYTVTQPTLSANITAPPVSGRGVPGEWYIDYQLTNGTVDELDMLDSDYDGMLNWQEWVAGSDPTNIHSVFRFTSTTVNEEQGRVVRWASASNRFYTLRRATNLRVGTNAFVILPGASNMPASSTANSYTDAVPGGGPFFYRIDVHP